MPFAGAEPNPFDPTRQNLAPETAPLEDIITKVVRFGALGLRVCMPAKVIAVRGDQTVDLQPMLQVRFKNSTASRDMDPLAEVPVVMPRGQDFRVGYPLAVGDLGLVLFADRNLDAFLASDGQSPQDPDDDRCHALSDAIFVPGLVPDALQSTDVQPSGDLVLQNGALTMRLQKSGRLSVHNGSQEVVDLVDQLVAANLRLVAGLQKALVLTSLGPAPFIASTVSEFSQIASLLQSLRQNLDTFKAGS